MASTSQFAENATKAEREPQWGIREFAAMFEVTPRTIRFYEDKGLLAPQREKGVRVFGRRDHLRFDAIMRGKRLGFSLDDIKAVFDVTDGSITDPDELIARKRNFEAVNDSLARRREDLRILSRDMDRVIAVIDDYLQDTPENNNVAALADRYQAAFDQTLTTNPFEFMSGQKRPAANTSN